MSIRFSSQFGITKTSEDDWFDPHLSIDTKLFVDPLLLYVETTPEWTGAHDELIQHFISCYELIARSPTKTAPSAQSALRLLTFPEPSEFGLGFTIASTRGSGSGVRFARQMADGIAVALAAGLKKPEHIEEIGVLNEGIGADRISDAVCNVLKHRFISYTQQVAARHNLQLDAHRVRHAACVPSQGRWLDQTVDLPTNPVIGKPVILVPRRFLNNLPVLNAYDWFDSSLNADVRRQLNLNVGERVRKSEIVEIARTYPDRVRTWAREQSSRTDLAGYDFDDDPMGVVQWDAAGLAFAMANPITTVEAVTDEGGLRSLLETVLKMFRRFVEDQGGWSLLWDSTGTPKNEEAIQLLFLGVAQNYLRLFDVELDREVELGRGPVDFKLSRGTSCRLLIEVKKAENGKFWNGLQNQLPVYLQSDDCPEGWFVAVRFSSTKASDKRVQQLQRLTARSAADSGKRIFHFAVDARRPVSASRA